MNYTNAKDYLPLVQAMADGKTLQVMTVNGWSDLKLGVDFCYSPDKYRIKPEPREIWVNRYPSGAEIGSYGSEGDAFLNRVDDAAIQIRYREVIE